MAMPSFSIADLKPAISVSFFTVFIRFTGDSSSTISVWGQLFCLPLFLTTS